MVTLLDGPNAGRTTTTGADGSYRFDGIRPGQVTVSATSQFGEDRAWVYANGVLSIDFPFAPEGRGTGGTFQGTIKATDPTCTSPGSVHDGKPCQRYGPFDVVGSPTEYWVNLDWLPGPNDLDFEVWRNGVRVTEVNHQMFGSRLLLASGGPSGMYEVRVIYVGTTTSPLYQLRTMYAW